MVDKEGITNTEVTLLVNTYKGYFATIDFGDFVCLDGKVGVVSNITKSTNVVEVDGDDSESYAITIADDAFITILNSTSNGA